MGIDILCQGAPKVSVEFFWRTDKAQRRRERGVLAFRGSLRNYSRSNGSATLPRHCNQHSALGKKRHEFSEHGYSLLE